MATTSNGKCSKSLADGTDITRSTDRELLVRALNEIFAIHHTLGVIGREAAEARAIANSVLQKVDK